MSRSRGPFSLFLAAAALLVSCGGSAVPYPVDAPGAADVADAAPETSDARADADAAVDVGDPCRCEVEDGCVLPPGCLAPECVRDGDCRDEDLCTDDRCDGESGRCLHEPIAECCTVDADCEDDNDCTVDRCVGKVCRHEPATEPCCTSDDACDDGFSETEDFCVDRYCVHSFVVPLADCDAPADCTPPNGCVAVDCVSGRCSHAPRVQPVGCQRHADCGDDDVCTDDFCVRFRCVHTFAADPQPQRVHDFDDLAAGASSIAGFALSGATGPLGWHVSARHAASSPHSLHYGEPETGRYDGYGPVDARAEMTPQVLPAYEPINLRFRTRVSIDLELGDIARVEILADGDRTATQLWDAADRDGSTGGTWESIDVDLSAYRGRTVRVRFVFVSVGATSDPRGGWYVDDIELWYHCALPSP